MKYTFVILSIFILTTLFSSCAKYNAGTGGKAKVTVKVIHGNTNINGIDVQVMYRATEFPGTNANYNNTILVNNTGNAIFDNLKRGNYYFYCTAMIDSSLKEAGAFINIGSKFGEQHVVIDFNQEDPL